jgi:hypothetical protein
VYFIDHNTRTTTFEGMRRLLRKSHMFCALFTACLSPCLQIHA